MKKRNITLWALTFLGVLFGAQAFAQQNVNMPYNTGAQTFTISPANCLFNFFDNGGPAANYSNSSNEASSVVTFAPASPANKVKALFNNFQTENSFDALYIRDGNTTGSPLISSGAPIGFTNLAGGWQGLAGNPYIINAGQSFTASAGNASGALTFQFHSDGSVSYAGWDADVFENAPGATCTVIAPPNVTVTQDPITCNGTAVVQVPTFTPGGCESTITLTYSINGGAPVTVNQPFPPTISIPNLPLGTYTITWVAGSQACPAVVISQATSTITVVSLPSAPPVFTQCPSDIIVNLGPGECTSIVSYQVCAADCSGFLLTNGPQGNISNNNPWTFNGQRGLFFNVQNNGGLDVAINSYRQRNYNAFGTPTVVNLQVFVTTTANTYVGNTTNPAAWTKVGDANVTMPAIGTAASLTDVIQLTTPIVLGAGQTKGLYIVSNFSYGGGAICANLNGAVLDNGTLRVTPGQLCSGFFNGTFFSTYQFFGELNYLSAQTTVCIGDGAATSGPGSLGRVAGLDPGSEFPIGTTQVRWRVTDKDNNTADCAFNVIVKEYPNPIQSLVCNDLVQVSLDANCSAVIGADQVLEGGPYGCYDDYIVELDKTAPFGNGPWLPAVLGPQDVGKTYQVRVTDPDNNNKCWGNIKVEDKLPPVLVCGPDTLLCNQDPAPGIYPSGSGTNIYQPTVLPITTQETETKTFSIPVTGLPSNAVILDVDFEERVTSTAPPGPFQAPWDYDLGIQLFNPGGKEVWPFWGYGGCGAVPVWAIWDDQSPQSFACATLSGGGKSSILPPFMGDPGALADYNGGSPNGNWSVRFGDQVWDNVGNDNANSVYTMDLAKLYIKWVAYGAGFPNDLTLNQTVFQTGPNSYNVPAGSGSPVLEPCSDATLTYIDTEVPQSCSSGLTKIIQRKWTATDASGNTATCIQILSFLRPGIGDVAPPPNYDDIQAPALECNSVYPTPEYLEGIGLQGWPHVYGEPDGCQISWTYNDNVIDVCDGTYKILRTWHIIDWCTGDLAEPKQIIKILDDAGPAMTCPANITVGTDPFTCCATTDLPDIIIKDNCSRIKSISAMVQVFDPQTNNQIAMYQVGGSLQNFPGNNLWDLDTLGNFGVTPCLPLGTHTVTYMAEDDCGNTSTCSFRVFVRDFTPPVAACDEFTVVGIGVDDPFDCYGPAGFQDVPPALDACSFAGVTWVKAKTFDDGSYDNCGDIKMTIRRMAPYSDCINGLNFLRGTPDCASPFPTFPSEFERAVSELDSIKFYCCEVGTEQTVILRVYQLDVNGNITVGQDGTPVYNECMITVEVQDKIKPVCQSPANVTVSCENFDPSLWAYGKPTVVDNCCLDTSKVYQGQCGLSHTVSYSLFDTVCNKGTITRTFRAWDCHGQSSQCTQRIVVNYEQDYWLKFPNDVIVTVCDGTGNYGEPTFNGEDCELLGVSHEDEIFTVVPDACYKIERTWTVINWCTYDPNKGCTIVPNPNPNATVNHPSNLTGPTISPLGTPAPWTPTNIAVAPGESPTNFSVFYHGGTYKGTQVPNIADVNCYKYKQIIKVIDTHAPVVQCPASPIDICDVTPNDPNLWNASYWYDAKINSHDLCEGPSDLCITGTDLCSGANIDIRYLLFLDLDGDNSMETVISSTNLPGFNNVQYGNAGNPNFGGGTSRQFDFRPVPSNQKYGFAMQTTTSGSDKTACVKWNTLQSPNNYVTPELPYGTHKIKWILSDGCGNEVVCEYTFVVKDCKAPTVVCINGLSVNIMPTKMVTLWDTDFLQYTEDNCTPSGQLVTAIRRSGTGTGFPTNPDGTPQKNVNFTCDDLGTQLVELWSIDAAGNADYCETYVIVQDNAGFCSNSNGTVAGALKTETNNGLEDADIDLNGTHPSLPPVSMFTTTDASGQYELNAIPFLGNYTVTPGKDNDPLNGVSTFDLVLINKHILGLEPLSTPYKMIAADANNSRSITTFDIVELRKLILGIYTELPNNTSWRFVDKAYSFPNPTNPFQTIFPETKQIADMQNSMMDENFVSVKVGDVNGNAVSSSLTSTDDRTAGTMLFDVEDRAVKAGETFTVNFKAADKVLGYQFTMNYNNLEVVDVVPGANMSINNFGVFANDHALTTSWDGDSQAEFGVTFRAKADGTLSQMLGVSSRITRAEAYNAGAERLQVAFRFNGANGSTIAGLGFELYQNTPNPFVNKTQIGFYLPQAGEATLTIFDESGRTIFTQKGDFTNGYNAVTIDRAVLNTTGVLYYKLETATDSATKKMIQSK